MIGHYCEGSASLWSLVSVEPDLHGARSPWSGFHLEAGGQTTASSVYARTSPTGVLVNRRLFKAYLFQVHFHSLVTSRS